MPEGLAPRQRLISVVFEHCTMFGLHKKYCGITMDLRNVNTPHTIRNVQMQMKSTVKTLVLDNLHESVTLLHYLPWRAHNTWCSDATEINCILALRITPCKCIILSGLWDGRGEVPCNHCTNMCQSYHENLVSEMHLGRWLERPSILKRRPGYKAKVGSSLDGTCNKV